MYPIPNTGMVLDSDVVRHEQNCFSCNLSIAVAADTLLQLPRSIAVRAFAASQNNETAVDACRRAYPSGNVIVFYGPSEVSVNSRALVLKLAVGCAVVWACFVLGCIHFVLCTIDTCRQRRRLRHRNVLYDEACLPLRTKVE
jgi:hypothetical protein